MEAVIIDLDAWRKRHQRSLQPAGDDIVEAWSSLMNAVMRWQWEFWGLSTLAMGRIQPQANNAVRLKI
jgi:hypothetical protein